MIKIILKKRRDQAVRRFHPWIFSGAIYKIEGKPQDGELVEVYAANNDFLAIGHYHDGSIAVRIISFQQTPINASFWKEKIESAYDYRLRIGLINNNNTNCYRLLHAEGDGLPGLIVDIYNRTAVVQCHSIGMYHSRFKISNAIKSIFEDEIESIYLKSENTLPRNFANNIQDEHLYGSNESGIVLENDLRFQVDWINGQKTGFFLDQRDNRQFLSDFVLDQTVLNAFCYSGGFSVYALNAGAKMVHSIDISSNAMSLTEKNIALNGQFANKHRSYTADVMQFLKDSTQKYEIIVVDPPAFAKSKNKRHNAIQAYKRLNILALKRLTHGGILFTFSCSQVVDRQLFYDTIVAAAIEAKRKVRVLRHLSQPADHPVNLFHAEGAYLKGLILYVE